MSFPNSEQMRVDFDLLSTDSSTKQFHLPGTQYEIPTHSKLIVHVIGRLILDSMC